MTFTNNNVATAFKRFNVGLYVDGKAQDEPYVKNGCNWTMSPHTVPKGKLFVVGDNRSMPIERHKFGMIDRDSLAGVPIW